MTTVDGHIRLKVLSVIWTVALTHVVGTVKTHGISHRYSAQHVVGWCYSGKAKDFANSVVYTLFASYLEAADTLCMRGFGGGYYNFREFTFGSVPAD